MLWNYSTIYVFGCHYTHSMLVAMMGKLTEAWSKVLRPTPTANTGRPYSNNNHKSYTTFGPIFLERFVDEFDSRLHLLRF